MTRLTKEFISNLKAADLISNPCGIDLELPDGRGLILGHHRRQHHGVKLNRYTVDRFSDRDEWQGCDTYRSLEHLKADLLGTLDGTAIIMQIDGTIGAVNINPRGVPAWRGTYRDEATGSWPDTSELLSTETEALVAAAEGYADVNSELRYRFDEVVRNCVNDYLTTTPPFNAPEATEADLVDWVINGAEITPATGAERAMVQRVAAEALRGRERITKQLEAAEIRAHQAIR